LIMGTAALGDQKVLIDGDASIRKRTVQPLLDALNALGAKAVSVNKNGCPPVEITGRMKGGRVEVDCRRNAREEFDDQRIGYGRYSGG
jgi:3-phosphoshikimate 1-carboxyvinyltransferase